MTANIGIDGTGVNCGSSTKFNTALAKTPVTWFEIKLAENTLALKKVKELFTSFRPSILTTVLHKLKIYIKVSK